MDNLARKLITPTEYLEMEQNSLEKHEYYAGEIFAMAGAKRNHNIIVSNLIITLGTQFKGKPCVVYPSDMKVVIDEQNHYAYPDVTIVCTKSQFLNSTEDALLNPMVIIEVLSDSTESYDRGKKFQAYRKIQSFQEYVLVSTEYKSIEVFSKIDNTWIVFYSDTTKKAKLRTVDCELTVEDVYDKVE